MSVNVSRLTNGNVYLDGKSYFGTIEEITLPDVKAVMSEHKALGMLGKIEFPSGIDKMESKIKWNSIEETAMKKTADFYTAVTLQVRSSLEVYDATSGRSAEKAVVATLRGQFKQIPGLGFKQQDNVEMESMLSVTAYSLEIDGAEIFDIDVVAQVYSVDGVDLLANYRNNLGI